MVKHMGLSMLLVLMSAFMVSPTAVPDFWRATPTESCNVSDSEPDSGIFAKKRRFSRLLSFPHSSPDISQPSTSCPGSAESDAETDGAIPAKKRRFSRLFSSSRSTADIIEPPTSPPDLAERPAKRRNCGTCEGPEPQACQPTTPDHQSAPAQASSFLGRMSFRRLNPRPSQLSNTPTPAHQPTPAQATSFWGRMSFRRSSPPPSPLSTSASSNCSTADSATTPMSATLKRTFSSLLRFSGNKGQSESSAGDVTPPSATSPAEPPLKRKKGGKEPKADSKPAATPVQPATRRSTRRLLGKWIPKVHRKQDNAPDKSPGKSSAGCCPQQYQAAREEWLRTHQSPVLLAMSPAMFRWWKTLSDEEKSIFDCSALGLPEVGSGSSSGKTKFQIHMDKKWRCAECSRINPAQTSICAYCNEWCLVCADELFTRR